MKIDTLERAKVLTCEDEDGGIVATCEHFACVCGVGDTEDEAIDDLQAGIADYLRRVTYH